MLCCMVSILTSNSVIGRWNRSGAQRTERMTAVITVWSTDSRCQYFGN